MRESKNSPFQEDGSTSRRSLIRRMTTATAVVGIGTGSTNTASAKESSAEQNAARKIKSKYSDQESIQNAISDHASKLFKKLQKEGYIPNKSVNEYNSFNIVSHKRYSKNKPQHKKGILANVGVIKKDGSLTAHISTYIKTDDMEVSIYIQPETEYAYARIEPTDSLSTTDDSKIISKDESDISITSSSCETKCDNCFILERCGLSFGKAYERECCDGRDPECITLDPCDCC